MSVFKKKVKDISAHSVDYWLKFRRVE